MAALFTWKFIQYRNKNAFKVMRYCLPTAKGAAETLKLNMALILLPVCRNTLTWLRSTKLGYFLPFDDNINFHKVDQSSLSLVLCDNLLRPMWISQYDEMILAVKKKDHECKYTRHCTCNDVDARIRGWTMNRFYSSFL